MATYEDISHLAIEVTDLEQAESFYAGIMGMEVIFRDNGELEQGRIVLKNGTGQLLFLELVDRLSARSRFRGPFADRVPDPSDTTPFVGAHLAMSVGSMEEYDEVHAKMDSADTFCEGDIRKDERAPTGPGGGKSDYFYDPFGNRLQLIILPGVGQGN
jgi:catechol 2,3-dioxygenase-like lactoylglutathione lyase family enzyme